MLHREYAVKQKPSNHQHDGWGPRHGTLHEDDVRKLASYFWLNLISAYRRSVLGGVPAEAARQLTLGKSAQTSPEFLIVQLPQSRAGHATP